MIGALILSLLVTLPVSAQEIPVGFITTPVWFSNTNPQEGETIIIYTVLFNSAETPLEATVQFLNEDTVLGKRTVQVPPKKVLDASIEWVVTPGTHRISALVENPVLISNGKRTPVATSEITSSPVTVTVASAALQGQALAVQEVIDSYTPAVVRQQVQALEQFRTTREARIAVRRDEAKSVLNSGSQKEESPAEELHTEKSTFQTIVQKIIRYATYGFFALIAFILSQQILFYGILIFSLYLLLKTLFIKLRR